VGRRAVPSTLIESVRFALLVNVRWKTTMRGLIPPQPKRLLQIVRTAGRGEPLETLQIKLVRLHQQPVCPTARFDPILPQHLP
jgi:hypothetical protein